MKDILNDKGNPVTPAQAFNNMTKTMRLSIRRKENPELKRKYNERLKIVSIDSPTHNDQVI